MKSAAFKLYFPVNVSFLISLVLLTYSIQPLKAQTVGPDEKAKLELFEDAITKGEQFLASKEYANAKAEYQKALVIDPSAKYPKDKLTYIRKFYIDPADEARYTQAMESGNRFMDASDYASARSQFEIAVNIKPEEKTARDKMAEAERLNLAKQESIKQFNKLIADADKLFAAKDMTGARATYDAASKIDQSASYPRQRIGEIDAKTTADKALKDAYEKTLSDGDEAYMNRDYTTARLKYEQALKIKPGENYPKSMLERVTEGSANLKDAQQNYQLAIASADKLFNDKDYETALTAYQNASKILPGEKYPSQQIEKINLVLDQKKNLDEEYAKTISSGNQLYDTKQYAEAKHEFQKANDLKPGETYPKQKIEEIAGLLLARKEAERNKVYTNLIVEADQSFNAKDYTNAISKYREAAVVKSEESYPNEKIAAITRLISDEQATRNAYEKTIADADQKFASSAWEEAIALYQSALKQKPGELYPSQQITKSQEAIELIKQKEVSYNQAVALADKSMGSGDYNAALSGYQQALAIMAGSNYPQEQIAKINTILAANRSMEEQYQKLIADADILYQSGSLPEALAAYNQALTIKSLEKYPADQIVKINNQIDELKAKQAAYNQQIASADKYYSEAKYEQALPEYQKALLIQPSEIYPQEKITAINSIIEQRKSLEENYTKSIAEGDKAITSGNLEIALSAFENARALKPAEKYPEEKISQIQKSLADQKTKNDNYLRIVADADRLFNSGELDAAALKYKEAKDLKPNESYPEEQIGKIKNLISANKEKSETYRNLIVEADRLYNLKNFDPALGKYQEALALMPSETYPVQQIASINAQKGEIAQTEQAYTEAIERADGQFNKAAWDESTAFYNEALKLKPGEQYPKDRIALIIQKKAERKSLEENYQTALTEADRLFDVKEYRNALMSYQKALALKPSETHPAAQITAINSILSEQKQLADQGYNEAIENANRLFSLQDYTSARKLYENASALKPEEAFPKNKLIEINNILMERSRNQTDAYNKIIMKADQAYQDKILDQAIDAYEEAGIAKPDETYPYEMIRKIRKYMEEHAMVDLVSEPILITSDSEQKFKFKPIEMRLRKNNYVIIKARKTGEIEPKVYLNYGIDGQKSGGIVLRSIKSQETGDYIVRVSIQDRWYRLDNNWISIYSEGGEVEISKMQITQGD